MQVSTLSPCLPFNPVLFDWHGVPQTNGLGVLERLGVLQWLLVDGVAQQCLACGRAALTLGQRLPYCGPVTFLPFRAYSPSPTVLLTGAQRAVVSSTFLAHNSMTVINTSTDSVLSIKNNIPVWLVGCCSGWRVSHDLFSLLPAPVVVGLSLSQIIGNRTMNVISKVIIRHLVLQLWVFCIFTMR